MGRIDLASTMLVASLLTLGKTNSIADHEPIIGYDRSLSRPQTPASSKTLSIPTAIIT